MIDETYREATYGNNQVIPSFAGSHHNTITVSSLSKCHGTPGLRLGWLYSSDEHFIKEVAIAKMNTVISNSVLDEYVAIQVLKKESQFGSSQAEAFYQLSRAAGIQLANGAWFGESKRIFRLGFGYMEIEKLIPTLRQLTEILNQIAGRN